MTDFIVWILLLLAGPSSLLVGFWFAWKIIKRKWKRFLQYLTDLEDPNHPGK